MTRLPLPANRQVLRAAAIAALGGLLFGFDTAVISGAEIPLERFFALDSLRLGLTVAAALIGTIAGSLLIEIPAESFGRKKTLLLLASLFLGSSLLSALAWNWPVLIASRFVAGLGIGGASVVVPMYIAEISPAEIRGRLVTINQLNIVLGIFLSFVSNYFTARFFPGGEAWRVMLGLVAVPSAIFFVLLFRLPESPRWLVKAGRITDAAIALRRLGHAELENEMAGIRQSLTGLRSQERLFQRRYLQPILLAGTLAMFNQLSGITALTYAPRIFGMAGASEQFALLESIGIGATNLVFTLVAISLIDRLGRRRLIVYGSFGYIASLGAVAWGFRHYAGAFDPVGQAVVLAGLVAFQASHALGQGAVLWVFISEIFPNAVRSKGQAFATFIHWSMAAMVGWSFPVLAGWWGGGVFALFAAMMFLQLLFAWKIMPETRNATLEEIGGRWADEPAP